MLYRDLQERQFGKDKTNSIYSSSKFIEDLELTHELRGHSGCVNALTWSRDGRLLASGSDDLTVNVFSAYSSTFQHIQRLYTGHTANIFGVKFLPHTNEHTLITCAGDNEIRVFSDLEHSLSRAETASRAAHVFRCHQDRVKKLVTEDSPFTFLSCSEDGEVRDFDLRQPQQYYNRSTAPPPLLSYRNHQIDVNTISVSHSNPHYLAVGGSHVHLFLHDRRMMGRDIHQEWGISSSSDKSTRCVRKFAPGAQRRMDGRSAHITACKFSNARPTELIGSWAAENVYLFDIHREPELKPPQLSTTEKKFINIDRKRKRGRASRQSRSRHEQSGHFVLEYADGRREEIDLEADTDDSRSISRASMVVQLRQAIFKDKSYTSAYSIALSFLQVSSDEIRNRGQRMVQKWVRATGHLAKTLSPLADPQRDEAEMEEGWGWRYDFLKNVLAWLSGRGFEPIQGGSEEAVIEVGEDSRVLFRTEFEMTTAFERASLRMAPDERAKRFWGEKVGRAVLMKLGEGLDFAFVDTAWGGVDPDLDEEEIVDVHAPEEVGIEGQEEGQVEERMEEDEEEDVDDIDDDDLLDSDESDDDDPPLERSFSFTRRPDAVEKDVPVVGHTRSYKGHCNVQTVKDVNFYGLDDEYVVSGSDDGNLFIWDRKTSRICQILRGDQHVVNVAQGHPHYPMLAVSGIDDTVKIFSPDADANRECLVSSRKRLHDEYQITSVNEVSRRQGLRDTFLTRHMLAQIAARIRQRQEDGGAQAQDIVLDECTVS